jgi:hypothetical protein
MGVTRVTKINKEGDEEATDRTYRHSYEVTVDTLADSEERIVLAASGIPLMRAPHPFDPSAFVTSRRARLREERRWKLWIVDVNYAVLGGEEDAITRPPDQAPDLWVPELRVRTATYERAILQDLDGVWFTNAARDLFPQHMRTITEYYPVVSYRRWWRTVDFDPVGSVLDWVGKVNESTWYVAAARTAQIQGINSEREFWNGQVFYRVDYEIAVRPDGWQITLPNEGMHTRGIDALGEGALRPIMLSELDEDGNKTGIRSKVSEPVPLTIDGYGVILDGLPPEELPPFRVYDDIDFADVGL